MSPVISLRDRATRPGPRVVIEWSWIVIAVVALVAAALIVPHLRPGRFVDEVRLVNGSEFDVDVDVASAPDDGWMRLGTAINRQTVTADEVYDIGDVWYVRYSAARGVAQERLTRADLERARWTLHVPDDFTDRLRAAGAAPSPTPLRDR